jgi:SPP1 gp7 family putative phage head morphogenesis protein
VAKVKTPPLRLRIGAPEETLRLARKRGVVLPDVYYGKMRGLSRSLAFSVAGVSSLEQLQAVKDSLDQALADGLGFEDWRKRVLRGEVPLNLPRHRLETIYRTNIQAAYSRGQGEQVRRNLKTHPYLLYSAVNDSRTRPHHKAWHGTILPAVHPWWNTHRPLNGYNCRCTVISLTEREAKRRGITEKPGGEKPDPGFDYDPWSDPRRGAFAAIERKRRNGDRRLARKADGLLQAAMRAGADDPDSWAKVGEQRGSNPGGVYQAPDGRRFYVKFYANPDQARAEVAALTLYRAAGIDALEPRLVERADPGGVRRLALATAWRDDLERFTAADAPKHAEELARIYQVSALTANWDVAGATLDNIARSTAGRLVILDAGGAFTFRAQGGAKPFDRDQVPELQSLRSPLVNRSAASVFNPALDPDVFRERDAARTVLDTLARAQAFEAAMVAGNVPTALAAAWRSALVGRAAAMRARYDLEGTYLPAEAAPYLDELRALFAGNLAAWSARTERNGGHRVSDDFQRQAPAMVATFEEWARRKFPHLTTASGRRDAITLLRSVFRMWSRSSSSEHGAILKVWAAARFGAQGARINWHADHAGDAAARHAEAVFSSWLASTGLRRADVFALLDAEYAFNQVLLRRAHGWDPFVLHRYMREAEYDANTSRGQMRPNAVASWTTELGKFYGNRLASAEFRAEWIVKVWQQGAAYMSYEGREAEYVAIGALLRLRP